MKAATVQVMGGLGNQLFSYAFGRALSELKNINVFYDCESAFWSDAYQREYILDEFENIKIKTLCLPKKDLGRASFKTKQRLKKYISINLKLSSKIYVLESEPYKFRRELIQTDYTRNIYFCGYWQSYKYFDSIKGLREELTPPLPKQNYSKEVLKKIKNSNSCAIHWRFYTEHKEYSYKLDSYYSAAISRMLHQHPDTKFFIFSDDHAEAKKMLSQHDIDAVFVNNRKAQGNRQSLDDFYLMHACNNIIIGNSSFSWWAAWLSDKKSKLIIFPDNLSPYGKDWSPDHWQKIEFDKI